MGENGNSSAGVSGGVRNGRRNPGDPNEAGDAGSDSELERGVSIGDPNSITTSAEIGGGEMAS